MGIYRASWRVRGVGLDVGEAWDWWRWAVEVQNLACVIFVWVNNVSIIIISTSSGTAMRLQVQGLVWFRNSKQKKSKDCKVRSW